MGGDFSETGRDLKLSDMFFNPDKLYEPGKVSLVGAFPQSVNIALKTPSNLFWEPYACGTAQYPT